MKKHLLWIFTGIFFPAYLLSQGASYCSNHKYPLEPAFEKIYIQPNQLINMPNGLYYYDDCGEEIKVNTVLGDEDGTYIVVVNYQCPLCGRTYNTKTPDENYGCPLFEKQGR